MKPYTSQNNGLRLIEKTYHLLSGYLSSNTKFLHRASTISILLCRCRSCCDIRCFMHGSPITHPKPPALRPSASFSSV
ncbi:hypothetical protein HanRHA438_Chr16g0765691 [Helianthus annuus]|nr:hypothetical protein HanRHA438_Chr16g0765691 [Helianthus annuus]